MWMALSLPVHTSRTEPWIGGFDLSHVVTVQTEVRDPPPSRPPAASSHCPSRSTARPSFFSGQAPGLLVRLPEWLFPVVIDRPPARPATITTRGLGDERHLHRFLQAYVVERSPSRPAEELLTTEQSLADGSILVEIEVEARHEEDHPDHRRPERRAQSGDEGSAAANVARPRFIEQALGQPVAERSRPSTTRARPTDQRIEQSQ